jgi:hypothetical protein
MREERERLEQLLEEERAERRRADMILAQLSQANAEQARTIRELEAPQEATEAAETVEEQPGRAEPRSSAGESKEPVQRPWWWRVFGRRTE